MPGARTGVSRGRDFVFIVVCNQPPHVVRVYSLDHMASMLGKIEGETGFDGLAECYGSGDWFEPGENYITELSLPKWAYPEE